MRNSAAAVIIGNEVLSGKVRDENGPHLIQKLWDWKMELRWMATVPDEVELIVDAIGRARQLAKHVFTSGGIGPTHDDVTVKAVASALGKEVVRLPEMEALVRQHYGPSTTPEALRLADAPEGASLWAQSGTWYPVLVCDNVYLLPGVPQLFRLQLDTVLARLEKGQWHLRCIYLSARESKIAAVLDKVVRALPQVAIGSYPNFNPQLDYAVKLTVEHERLDEVEGAVAQLLAQLPASSVLRVE